MAEPYLPIQNPAENIPVSFRSLALFVMVLSLLPYTITTKLTIMKRLPASIMLLFISCSLVQAQLPQLKKGALSTAANPGQLLTQFINALKPTSFTSAWTGAKDGVLGKAQKAANAVEIASTVSSLVGFIKPDLFKQGSTAKSLLDMSNKVKTMGEATSLLKSFEGGLQPAAFTGNWSSMRTGWLSALNQLK